MSLNNATPFIAGNWKMFKTVAEADELVKEFMAVSADLMEAEVVIIPPFTALNKIRKTLCENPIQLGAQNVHWEAEGAYTGEISSGMLKEAGCQYVVIGHSERRQYFGETNQSVNKKIKAVLNHEMYPIMCIGETLEERENGKTFNKLGNQIDEGLEGL
ncbi:MAG: triose-phosphate isomerase, partial [Candidatus Aminicenantes bacterium]|nr:triose-phosphate isomerase [Candidatus Aminicenantes bacterium]